jgi:hypothetical protein
MKFIAWKSTAYGPPCVPAAVWQSTDLATSTILPTAHRPGQQIPVSTNVLYQTTVLTTVRRFVERVLFDIFIALHVQDPLTTSL